MKLAALIIILCIVMAGGIFVLYVLSTREDRDRTRTGTDDPRARIIRQNHVAMARLIENLLRDDMIYPVIPQDERDNGKKLLATYYNQGISQ